MASRKVNCASPARFDAPVKITAELLEKCLDRVAFEIDRNGAKGTVYLPIYERLEVELAALKCKQDGMERARLRLVRANPKKSSQSVSKG